MIEGRPHIPTLEELKWDVAHAPDRSRGKRNPFRATKYRWRQVTDAQRLAARAKEKERFFQDFDLTGRNHGVDYTRHQEKARPLVDKVASAAVVEERANGDPPQNGELLSEMLEDLPILMRIDEVAKVLRVDPVNVQSLVRNKRLKATKIGAKKLIPRTELWRFLRDEFHEETPCSSTQSAL